MAGLWPWGSGKVWKFAQFCEAIGFSVDDLSNEKEFIGREAELVAVKDGDKTYYEYQKPGGSKQLSV